MPKLKRLHVASTGTRPSRSGTLVALSQPDIDELASSYQPHLHQCKLSVDDVATAISLGAPAVLGHFDPRLVEAKGAMPAFGRVLSAKSDQSGLFLDMELTDSLADWITDGLYDHVSVSWYDRQDPRNPTPGQLHLRHVGWLGAEPSAMKDLSLPDSSEIEWQEADLWAASNQQWQQANVGEHMLDMPSCVFQPGVYQNAELTVGIHFVDIEQSEATTMATSKTAAQNEAEAETVTVPTAETIAKPEAKATTDEEAATKLEQTEAEPEMAEPAVAEPAVAATDSAAAAPEEAAEEAVPGEQVDPVLLLTSILQDGDKGYKGEISEYRPEATADNSYLWSEEAKQFAGQFVDMSGNEEEVYDFTLALQEDGSMIRSYKRVFAEAEAETTDAPTDAQVEAEADSAETEFGEGCGSTNTTDSSTETIPKGLANGLAKGKKPSEMGEYGGDLMQPLPQRGETEYDHMIEPAEVTADTVSLSQTEYQALLSKAALADELAEVSRAAARQSKLVEIAAMLQPLYDTGLVDGYVAPESIANAILAMDESAEYGYECEFGEGKVLTSPIETVTELLKQIGNRAKTNAETEIEFGEMAMPKEQEMAEAKASKSAAPKGTVNDPKQAELDQKARQICKDKGWDCGNSKDYVKAIKLAMAAG